MERIVADAVRSQIESWEPVPAERALRMPLGLILLSRGWISHRELQEALAAQRRAQNGRIGEWLRRLHGISEETITKALGIQWNCAVLPLGMQGLELTRPLIPAFLRKRYGLALLRQGSDRTLYLAGKHRAEHAAARAMEHMLREPVHAAFLEDQCVETLRTRMPPIPRSCISRDAMAWLHASPNGWNDRGRAHARLVRDTRPSLASNLASGRCAPSYADTRHRTSLA